MERSAIKKLNLDYTSLHQGYVLCLHHCECPNHGVVSMSKDNNRRHCEEPATRQSRLLRHFVSRNDGGILEALKNKEETLDKILIPLYFSVGKHYKLRH